MQVLQELEIMTTTLLWQMVSDRVEQVSELSKMLHTVAYLEHKDLIINRITRTEIIDAEPCDITSFKLQQDVLSLTFTMPFVLSAWKKREQVLRVTAVVLGDCQIKNVSLLKEAELEAMSVHELRVLGKWVHFDHITYEDVECDDVFLC